MAQARHESITRRSLLSGVVAAVPAAAMPSLIAAAPAAAPALKAVPAAAPDPIFAAIEAHSRAYDQINVVLDAVAAAEDALDAAPRGKRRAARKRLNELCAEEGRLGRIESNAIDCLVATAPQTLQGAAATLAYVRKRYEEGYPMCEEEGFMALLGSIQQTICAAAGLPAPAVQPWERRRNFV